MAVYTWQWHLTALKPAHLCHRNCPLSGHIPARKQGYRHLLCCIGCTCCHRNSSVRSRWGCSLADLREQDPHCVIHRGTRTSSIAILGQDRLLQCRGGRENCQRSHLQPGKCLKNISAVDPFMVKSRKRVIVKS